jgi:DNA-3-methyladenine glycosylase II
MKKVIAHFKQCDPILHAALTDVSVLTRTRELGNFPALCRIIIGQQVSTKAARAIYARFEACFPCKTPSPSRLLALDEEVIRGAGLSHAKYRSVRDLAERVTAGTLRLNALAERPDDEVIAALTEVRGIGTWSAEMYLMFHLDREDIFSPGDLGLRTAIYRLYRMRALPTPTQAKEHALRWAPYRTYACRILWSTLDNTPG